MSVPEICLIAPSRTLAKRTAQLAAEHHITVGIYTAALEDAVACAKRLMDGGAQVIISRFGTKALLERQTNATVVGIHTFLSDYVAIMEQAKKASGLVAFFSYDPLSDDVQTMCRLQNIQVRHYDFRSDKTARESVARALADGAVLGTGGVITEKAALELGLPYVPLHNSAESILTALETAKDILSIKKQEQARQDALTLRLNRYQAVFDFTHDAIVSVDSTGQVDLMNAHAKRLLHLNKPHADGRDAVSLLPEAMVRQTLQTGSSHLAELVKIQGMLSSMNCVPISVEGQIKGAVLTFQDVKALQSSEQKIRINLHEKGLTAKYQFSHIVGTSPAILSCIETARSYAKSDATVSIFGETGTGKELFAQSIHNESRRNHAPFVAINCATLDSSLLESELFGYVDGAFTGARRGGKAGLFELAHTGTLFLDEIGEIPIGLQARLLRVLQEKEIRRMGGDVVVPVDVRIIVATNRDLQRAVADKEFRADLYYRLQVLRLPVPPLRERGSDVLQIGLSLFRQFAGTQYEVYFERFLVLLHQLQGYEWPGNVRELTNFVERAYVLLSSGAQPETALRDMNSRLTVFPPKEAPLEIFSEDNAADRLSQMLAENGGNLSKTAAALGVSRTTLWRRLKKAGLQPK